MKSVRSRRPARPVWDIVSNADDTLNKLIANSRSTGTLNLASKQLQEVGRAL